MGSADLGHLEPLMQSRIAAAAKGQTDKAARAICQERCAFMGEPACWKVSGEWPNPNCDDPGCFALASVAIDAVRT